MAIQLDKKYANRVSSKLSRFRWDGDDVANFRCPICGDSKKSKTKARGYFYPYKDFLMVSCKNCGYSHPFHVFLKEVDVNLYNEYVLESVQFNNEHRWHETKIEKQNEKVQQVVKTDTNNPLDKLQKLSELPEVHKAVQTAIKRKIPRQFWDKLYYTPNFKTWVNDNIEKNKFKKRLFQEDERIVIPFFNSANIPFAYQGRYIGDNEFKKTEQRYLTINPVKDNPLIYGLERVDFKKPIFIVEGPIDSMFIPNCLAAAGSSLMRLLKYKNIPMVFVFDNEPRNLDICLLMQKIIELGHSIVIWPYSPDKKEDINDLVLMGKDAVDIVNKNVYNNKVLAQLQFDRWKRI